ncbi:hypothetical protein K9B32_20870 [Rhizobium sp. 3T7]|uniref:hypothetical protein n=1 Tax=Rhizobium sp. 3T7 TaxID=2874922 RepID=UPI001CCA7262|nr:hypothetical protein [Rhizobium sp. 3T7]MBZ9792538.1 hypothetical protein [Rhizobium sp. 3T7]
MTRAFTEWTYEQERAQIIEAGHTLRASPGDLGPRLASGAMSDVVRDMMEAYSYQEAKAPRIPSAYRILEVTEVIRPEPD